MIEHDGQTGVADLQRQIDALRDTGRRFSADGAIPIDGVLDHRGSLLGFYGAVPRTRQTVSPVPALVVTDVPTAQVAVNTLVSSVNALLATLRATGLIA